MADEFTWDPDARSTLDALLSDIPFLYRSRARILTIKAAEDRARMVGTRTITRDEMLIAMIQATPGNLQQYLRTILEKRRIPQDQFEEFFS